MFFFDCRILNHAPLFVEKKDVNFAWSVWNPTAGKIWFGHDIVKSQQRRLIDETYSCLTKLTAVILYLGGGFKYFLFSSLFGEMIQFDRYFSNGLKPPTSIIWILLDTRIWANCNGWKFFVKSDFSHGKEFPWKIKASPLKIPDRRRSEEIGLVDDWTWKKGPFVLWVDQYIHFRSYFEGFFDIFLHTWLVPLVPLWYFFFTS